MMKLVVLSCVMAAASASVVGIAPLAYTAGFGYGAPFAYGAPLAYPAALENYRGPLSLAPGQPANILGLDGRPLDTLDVNLDRASRIAAKLGVHVLKKRSAALIAPITPIDSSIVLAQSQLITPANPILGRVGPVAAISPYPSYAAPYATYW